MMVAKTCNLCEKQILSHAIYLRCSSGLLYTNIQCLPFISKHDPLYTQRANNNWLCTYCTQSVFPFNYIIDNIEIVHALAEQWHNEIPVSLDELNERLFNPFELNENVDTSPLFDIDPDFHFFNTTLNFTSICDYYVDDTFNRKCTRLDIDDTCFTLLHMNLRSLPKNIDDFKTHITYSVSMFCCFI
jgi:hypothetical protein